MGADIVFKEFRCACPVHLYMTGIGMCGRRHDTQRKPYPAVGGEGKRRQLVVDKDFPSFVENVEVVGDICSSTGMSL